MVGGQVVARADRVDRPGEDVVRHQRSPEEVLQQVLALRGQDRLGVELDALGRQLAVAGAHHHVAEAGAELELVGQVGVGDQRVVAAGDQRARQAGVDRAAVVARPRRPCRGSARPARCGRRTPRPATGGRGRRRAPACRPRRRRGSPRPRSPASAGVQGPGETTRRSAPRSSSSSTVGLVVADHLDLRPQLAQVLDEVVGEAVVVVDHEDFHALTPNPAARRPARPRGRPPWPC